jgi:hypothetical protein
VWFGFEVERCPLGQRTVIMMIDDYHDEKPGLTQSLISALVRHGSIVRQDCVKCFK